MDRRHFLSSLGALSAPLVASCTVEENEPVFKGEVLGPNLALGHRLRAGDLPPPTETRSLDIAIVGGGVAGLSAAWHLARQGVKTFKLFELESVLGGNARAGKSAVTPYPWGAHYLPLPPREAVHVRQLLADLGVLKSGIGDATPVYDETALVHNPQDRLYRNGLWQEGLLPKAGVQQKDLDQYRRFEDIVEIFKGRRDLYGAKAFAIPSLDSSRDLRNTSLDSTDMRRWMVAQGFDSPVLHWYVDYACRDDYGSLSRDTSAWAGMHYFASRDGNARDADQHQVLTWPEGNGYLTRRMGEWLSERVSAPFSQNALCCRVHTERGHTEIDIFHADENRTVRYRARRVLWAAPAFVLARVWDNPPPTFRPAIQNIEYVPWLVANLHLKEPPRESGDVGLAWDNVIYGSNALGYVVATHQTIRTKPGPTVLTYYWPHSGDAPKLARQRLFDTPWEDWLKAVLADLRRPHPRIAHSIEKIELWRWGHAMPQVAPGFLSAPERTALASLKGSLVFAHSDLSGMSLFEEANYAGVRAAQLAARG